jgi:hypothetical protein
MEFVYEIQSDEMMIQFSHNWPNETIEMTDSPHINLIQVQNTRNSNL